MKSVEEIDVEMQRAEEVELRKVLMKYSDKTDDTAMSVLKPLNNGKKGSQEVNRASGSCSLQSSSPNKVKKVKSETVRGVVNIVQDYLEEEEGEKENVKPVKWKESLQNMVEAFQVGGYSSQLKRLLLSKLGEFSEENQQKAQAVFRGKNVCVDVRTNDGESVSESFKNVLGNALVKRVNKQTDFLVWKDGSASSITCADNLGIAIRSVGWLGKCITEERIIDDSLAEYFVERTTKKQRGQESLTKRVDKIEKRRIKQKMSESKNRNEGNKDKEQSFGRVEEDYLRIWHSTKSYISLQKSLKENSMGITSEELEKIYSNLIRECFGRTKECEGSYQAQFAVTALAQDYVKQLKNKSHQTKEQKQNTSNLLNTRNSQFEPQTLTIWRGNRQLMSKQAPIITQFDSKMIQQCQVAEEVLLNDQMSQSQANLEEFIRAAINSYEPRKKEAADKIPKVDLKSQNMNPQISPLVFDSINQEIISQPIQLELEQVAVQMSLGKVALIDVSDNFRQVITLLSQKSQLNFSFEMASPNDYFNEDLLVVGEKSSEQLTVSRLAIAQRALRIYTAMTRGKEVVSDKWIETPETKKTALNFKDFRISKPESIENGQAMFSGKSFWVFLDAIHSMQKSDKKWKQAIENLLRYFDGNVIEANKPPDAKENTMVIFFRNSTKPSSWKKCLTCVIDQWIYDSIQVGHLLSIETYRVQ